MEASYQDICRAKSVTPKPEVIKVLKSKQDSMLLNFPIVFLTQTDNDFFCIICVLQENLSFLSTLSIQNLDLSPVSLNLLTKLFKVTTYLKKLSITHSKFPSTDSFCLLCSALQNNSHVTSLNLSSNSLNDNYGMYICDLITNSSYIKEIVLDHNLFKDTDFGQCLSVSNVESVSLNSNPLSPDVFYSVLMSSKVNLNMRNLSLKGVQVDSYAEECVADAIEYSKLVCLGFDLTDTNLKVLKKIENALVYHNKTLVMINSGNIDWNEVGEDHRCFGIKKGLLANMWFFNEDMKNSVIGQEAFEEVQFIVLKKMKNSPQKEFQREMAGTPDFRDNTGKSSISSLLYSDSSFVDTKEKGELMVDDKVKFDFMVDAVESLNGKFRMFVEQYNENSEKLTRLEKDLQKLQGHSSYLQNQESRIENRLLNSVEEMIDEAKQSILLHLNQITENLPPPPSSLPFPSDSLHHFISETEEKFKSLDMKLEKQYFHIKSTFKNLNNTYSTVTQHQLLHSQTQNLSQAFEDLSERSENTLNYCEKLLETSNSLSKTVQSLQKQINDTEKNFKDLVSGLSVMDEKVNNTLKIREILKSRDEEIYKKLYSVECDLLEVKNNDKLEEIQASLQKISLKLDQTEEIFTKNQENNLFQLTEQNLLITEVQQKLMAIECLKQQTPENEAVPREESFELSVSDLHMPGPTKLSYSNNLINRLEKLEKLNIHKKALEVIKAPDEQLDFVPGEAENLVRSAVLERVNKLTNKPNSGLYRTLCPSTPKNFYSSFEEDLQPSQELRESLKHKGLFFNQF